MHLKATADTVKKTYQSNMKKQQHYVSMMQRSETLPKDADTSSLMSDYKNGVLVLTLQKKESAKQPVVNEKAKQTPVPMQKIPKKQEKKENSATKVGVPHTGSHV